MSGFGISVSEGYLSLVLHAHLPFVRHPEFETFHEEQWLFEAITETYLPLLKLFATLQQEQIRFRLTLSLSPTLVAMFQDRLLQRRYLEHMRRLIRLAERELVRTRGDPSLRPLALLYHARFLESVEIFTSYDHDLVNGFMAFQQSGLVELITTAATHGYLPLLRMNNGAVRAQILLAAQTHERVFGKPALGVWLPECGYYPGLESLLGEAGFSYFIVDTHGILNASVSPRHGVHAPLACCNGVAAFGRDPESSRQVWSAVEGYPGDPDYREFHRDIGYDLELDDLSPMLQQGQPRFPTGIKYHRVTGHDQEQKQLYRPDSACRQADRHAAHFLQQRQRQMNRLAPYMDRPPLVLAPYDAELFGHWWFEGPRWLECLIRRVQTQDSIRMLTPSDYLRRHPVLQCATPSASSWGEQGYSSFWLNESNAWVYPQLHQGAQRLQSLARDHQTLASGSPIHRALCQAARSLLLAQASDWTFMMKAGTTVEYAQQRIREQLARFHYLDHSISTGTIDEPKLRALEAMDNLFPDIDLRMFLEPYPETGVDF